MMRRNATSPSLAEEIGKRTSFASAAQEAFLNLQRTYEQLAADFDRLFKEHGISASQYNALRILRGHGQRMRTYQVAHNMISREPDITRLLDRLVDAGLVERQRCPLDRRVVWVDLADAGRKLLKRLDQPLLALHESQLGHLGKRKLGLLNGLLVAARRPN